MSTNELREAAQQPWTVEEAISDRKGLIGWLLRLGDQSLQIWRDQAWMPGFRCGSGFVPSIGETITYRAALTATTNEAAAQAEARLTEDARVGHCTFSVGVPERMVIEAAQRAAKHPQGGISEEAGRELRQMIADNAGRAAFLESHPAVSEELSRLIEENERLSAAALSRPVDIDALAQEIRRIDGSNSLGAGALAERIVEWLGTRPVVEQTIPAAQAGQAQGEVVAWICQHPDGTLSNDVLMEWEIEQVRRDSGAWVPLGRIAPAVDRGLSEAFGVRKELGTLGGLVCKQCGYLVAEQAMRAEDGAMVYRGHTVAYIYDRAEALSQELLKCWGVLGECGHDSTKHLQPLHERLKSALAASAPSQAEPVDHHCQHPGFNPYAGDACPACAPSQAGSCQASVEVDREAVHDALGECLDGALDCTRVWSAWSVGTMRQDDFVPVTERLNEITDAVLKVLAPPAGRTLTEKAFRDGFWFGQNRTNLDVCWSNWAEVNGILAASSTTAGERE